MSQSASRSQLAPAVSQLPVSAYFDEKIFELEMRLLFDAGPGYVGHELMVPEKRDYQSLAWLDHARLLMHNDDGVHLMSNICRHRQAIMLEGRGQAQNVVCMPARATMITGQHVRSHGVLMNGIALPEDAPSVVAHLKARKGSR